MKLLGSKNNGIASVNIVKYLIAIDIYKYLHGTFLKYVSVVKGCLLAALGVRFE